MKQRPFSRREAISSGERRLVDGGGGRIGRGKGEGKVVEIVDKGCGAVVRVRGKVEDKGNVWGVVVEEG